MRVSSALISSFCSVFSPSPPSYPIGPSRAKLKFYGGIHLNLIFLLDWITTPIHWMTWNLVKAMKLHWTRRSPSLALALKFVQDIDLPENCQLSLLNFEALKVIKRRTSYFHDMELNENQNGEKELLRVSSLSWFPHETAQIKIINHQGERFCSRIFHGRKSSLSQFETLRSEVKNLVFRARKRGLLIKEIEIAHTHPSLEVMIEHRGKSKFIFNGLSETDQRLGKRLAPFLDYPLRIKAITPTANYSKLF